MNKLTGIFLLMGAMCFSQQNKGIEKPIRNLFLAMKNADTDLLKTVFTENAVLQTITKDGVVKTDSIQDFITSVSKFSQGDLEEKIIVEAVHTDGNLASVFTPYSFYLKGKFSHCGLIVFSSFNRIMNGKFSISLIPGEKIIARKSNNIYQR